MHRSRLEDAPGPLRPAASRCAWRGPGLRNHTRYGDVTRSAGEGRHSLEATGPAGPTAYPSRRFVDACERALGGSCWMFGNLPRRCTADISG